MSQNWGELSTTYDSKLFVVEGITLRRELVRIRWKTLSRKKGFES